MLQLKMPPPVRLSDMPALNWGGRALRYADTPRQCVRGYDPYRFGPLVFGSYPAMVCWHHVRLDSNTSSLTGKRTVVEATIGERHLKADATFISYTRSGTKLVHLVCDAGTERGRLATLREICSRSRGDTRVVEHDVAALMADAEFNHRLERIVQASVLHLQDGPSSDPIILAALRDVEASTRSALCLRLPNMSPQLIDGRLGHLHCFGFVVMDLSRNDYAVRLRPVGGTK